MTSILHEEQASKVPDAKGHANTTFKRPHELVPKLFGPFRERYADRPGGYTRVLRIEPLKEDQALSAILELVDGPKDMRFAMTARAILRQRRENLLIHELTAKNIDKVTRYRTEGEEELEEMVRKFEDLGTDYRLDVTRKKEGEKVERLKMGPGVDLEEVELKEPRKLRVYPGKGPESEPVKSKRYKSAGKR